MALLDRLFKKMVESKASDLHISSNNVAKWRLHGDICDIEGEKINTPEDILFMLEEIMPEKNFYEFKDQNDTDFAYELEGYGRFRANAFSDRNGPGAVFRLIPTKIITAEDLDLPSSVLDLCFLSKGLVLVTGPTGSGKSTTLSAMVDYINRNRTEHIITIEDPIEFVHENKKCLINQREVKVHTKTFKSALKAALREDPDIVLVGEMRDLETVEIAIETAETGHLVFGTLHTSTAAGTVERIIQQFPSEKQAQIRQMLSGSLKGVISQNLLKTKDGNGRVAAMEILIGNSAIAAQIRDGKTHQIESTMQISGNQGMVLLNDALLTLVEKGKVDPAEAYKKSIDKADLLLKFKANMIPFIPDNEYSRKEDNGFSVKNKRDINFDDFGNSTGMLNRKRSLY
ncbi:MAG: type IV pilus twitching motility protein PilT [Fusobacteria bacterium]|nr:type IV pilus twitching motility protein PilT [Fusobacteriota bacterium]